VLIPSLPAAAIELRLAEEEEEEDGDDEVV